jgi:hypothetical protein
MRDIFSVVDDLGPSKVVYVSLPESGLNAVVAIDNSQRARRLLRFCTDDPYLERRRFDPNQLRWSSAHGRCGRLYRGIQRSAGA